MIVSLSPQSTPSSGEVHQLGRRHSDSCLVRSLLKGRLMYPVDADFSRVSRSVARRSMRCPPVTSSIVNNVHDGEALLNALAHDQVDEARALGGKGFEALFPGFTATIYENFVSSARLGSKSDIACMGTACIGTNSNIRLDHHLPASANRHAYLYSVEGVPLVIKATQAYSNNIENRQENSLFGGLYARYSAEHLACIPKTVPVIGDKLLGNDLVVMEFIEGFELREAQMLLDTLEDLEDVRENPAFSFSSRSLRSYALYHRDIEPLFNLYLEYAYTMGEIFGLSYSRSSQTGRFLEDNHGGNFIYHAESGRAVCVDVSAPKSLTIREALFAFLDNKFTSPLVEFSHEQQNYEEIDSVIDILSEFVVGIEAGLMRNFDEPQGVEGLARGLLKAVRDQEGMHREPNIVESVNRAFSQPAESD